MPGDLCTASRIISLSPLSLATDVTDATFGANGLWLGTRTGAGGTDTLIELFLAAWKTDYEFPHCGAFSTSFTVLLFMEPWAAAKQALN